MTSSIPVIVGGGLAGCEAAWQLLKKGHEVRLFEMKPLRFSAAHCSPSLAELVCSNSLRSDSMESAVGLLKQEMRMLGSLLMEAAKATAVPAGKALAVDRVAFSRYIEERLLSCSGFVLIREEIAEIPEGHPVIIASGPLTATNLTRSIRQIAGEEHLYFYDAISPIVDGDSLDYTKLFRASRYAESGGDYLNCPFEKNEYERFWEALVKAEEVPLNPCEEARYFEGCLPIEIIARRGIRTLAFGPMKPVGLIDPRTGRQPYAVLQLRQEDRTSRYFNMVGFQTKLTWPEQRRIFRMIPGLEKAEFARYGSIHRNTFINSPALLRPTLQMRTMEEVFFAGQISGVEGYVESAAMGIIAGLNVGDFLAGREMPIPPSATALGALVRYITESSRRPFQPSNVNFSLFPPLTGRIARNERGKHYASRALIALEEWIADRVQRG